MIVLAFDTCLDKTYAVIKRNGVVLSSEIVENRDSKYHSAFLISTLRKIMKENSISPKDIDLIGVNIGPGSFTGIRACVTVARVMAQELNCKAVGVSSLEILANVGVKNPLVALDARKDSAYLYFSEEQKSRCQDVKLIKSAVKLDEVKRIIQTGNFDVITDDKLQPLLGGVSYQKENYPLGEILADLAEKKLDMCDGNWADLKPLYIQPPPVW